MTITLSFRAGVMAAAVAGIGLASAGPAQAGLFDFLFGGSGFQQPQQPVYQSPGAIDVRVNPRRRVRSERGEPRRERAARGPRPERKVALATPIDPVKNPNWHLDDPTLKRGDIVVLKGKVLVFNGGSSHRVTSDFTSLDKSRLVSGSEREKIMQSTGAVASASDPSTVSASLEVTE